MILQSVAVAVLLGFAGWATVVPLTVRPSDEVDRAFNAGDRSMRQSGRHVGQLTGLRYRSIVTAKLA